MLGSGINSFSLFALNMKESCKFNSMGRVFFFVASNYILLTMLTMTALRVITVFGTSTLNQSRIRMVVMLCGYV